MKKKFLILTLCFTLIFSSISYKRSYADGGLISLPMVGVVSALAVGTGVALNNIDDIYDLGNMFYNYVKNHNSLTMSAVVSAFNAGCTITGNKLVSVDSNFLDIVKGFFDNTFETEYSNAEIPIGSIGSLPLYGNFTLDISNHLENTINIGENTLSFHCSPSTKNYYIKAFAGATQYITSSTYYNQAVESKFCNNFGHVVQGYSYNPGTGKVDFKVFNGSRLRIISSAIKLAVTALGTFPYNGGYSWDNVEDRVNENNELPLPIPGNLDNLVGNTKDEFWSNSYEGTKDGTFDISDVSNPSISIDKTQSIVGSITGGGVVEGVKPSLPSLPSWGSGLDFSPITQGVFSDKFPFCLAKDVKDIISVFDVPSRNLKEPVFKVPFLGEELVLDFREFKLWFDIIKFFVLIGFIISLIVLTRGIIG